MKGQAIAEAETETETEIEGEAEAETEAKTEMKQEIEAQNPLITFSGDFLLLPAMETLLRSAVLAAALCFLCLCSSASYAPFGKPLRLSSVPSLTFSKGRDTTYRRSSPIRQLLCEKGCHLHDPDEVRCTNVLLKDNEVFWECEADLPSDVSLKNTEVNCEGYDSKEDGNVLEGSCGLKYSLVRKGSQRRSGYQYWLLLMTIVLVPLHLYTVWYRRT